MSRYSEERWRPVVGFEGLYEISDIGRVRSLPRRGTSGQVLKQCISSAGYPYVNLCGHGAEQTSAVHALVAAAFLGSRPSGHEVRHLDGNPANNLLGNLLYGTRSENVQDSLLHGTNFHASKTHCPQGHEYTAENTRVHKGRRLCRSCQNAGRASRRLVAKQLRLAEKGAE